MLDRQLAGTPYVRTDTIPEQWLDKEANRFLQYDVDSMRIDFIDVTLHRTPQLSVDHASINFILLR